MYEKVIYKKYDPYIEFFDDFIFLILVRVLGQLSPLSWLGEKDLTPLLIPSAMPHRGEGHDHCHQICPGEEGAGGWTTLAPSPASLPISFKKYFDFNYFCSKSDNRSDS